MRPMLPVLPLSFAAQGFPLLRVIQWTLAMTVPMLLIAVGWLWWDTEALTDQARQYEVATQRVEQANRQFVTAAAQDGIDLSPARMNSVGREMVFLTQLVQTKALSWTRLLTDLEETVPDAISVSSVTLNFTDSTIALNGSARTLKDLTAFVTTLEAHPAFRNVVLSQHRVSQRDNVEAERSVEPPGGVRPAPFLDFAMTAQYAPRT